MTSHYSTQLLGAGRSPAFTGHGWPAPALAVGPAAKRSQAVYIINPADPLLFTFPLQKLPQQTSGVNLDHDKGKAA